MTHGLQRLHGTASAPRPQVASAPRGRRPQLRPLACSSALALAPPFAPASQALPTVFAQRFEVRELLGEGAFGCVHAVMERTSGEHFAVKVQPKQRNNRCFASSLKQEADFYSKLAGVRGMVQIHGVYEDDQQVCIVHELCSGGDLQTLQEQYETFDEHEAAQVMHGVLTFLADCHARHICYGDVKPANFVLKRLFPSVAHMLDPSQPRGELQVRAIDFGCCQEYKDGITSSRGMSGTPMYMAPEVLLGRSRGLAVDVWAAGVMLYQLMTDRFPFWDMDMRDMSRLAMARIKDDIISGDIVFEGAGAAGRISPAAQGLLHRLLDKDDARRITAAAALEHPWFKQFEL